MYRMYCTTRAKAAKYTTTWMQTVDQSLDVYMDANDILSAGTKYPADAEDKRRCA